MTESDQAAVEQPAFMVEPDVLSRASYAMAHNRQATVRTVRVRNLRSVPGSLITITVSSSWTATSHPPLASQSFVVECPEQGDWLELDTSSCRLDDTALVDLDEGAPATVTVTVSDDAGRIVSASRELIVLARTQWNRDLPSMTASFVQPNHPAVVEVLKEASRILLASTNDSRIQGYQKGPARATEIAKAVFQALQHHVPTYVNPPASFDEEGQKIRPLDQVLEQGQGTCIDLACAYASCLEQAGINPVIALVHGHAFTLYFTEDDDEGGRLPSPVIEDVSTILNLTDRDLLIPVEATGIPGKLDFEIAVHKARTHLNDRRPGCPHCESLMAANAPQSIHPHLQAAVDVMQCHRRGIRPLPARVVRDGIVTIVVDNGPSEPPVTERRDAKTNKLMPETIPARVQQWKNSLLDLTVRPGGLLNFDAVSRGVALMPPKGSLGAIEDYLIDGGRIEVLSDERLDPIQIKAGFRSVRDLADDLLAGDWKRSHSLYGVAAPIPVGNRMKALTSRAKLEFQETGVNNLMLTLGSVVTRGGGSKGGDISAPVFLVPITVNWNRGRTAPIISLDPTAMTSVNYALLETLRSRPTPLPLEWFRNDMRDDSGLDIMAGLEQLREEILAAGASDQLDVIDDAAIGVLRFTKIRLWKDLDDHWESFLTSPIVRHLVEGGNGNFQDPADPGGTGAPAFDDTTLQNPQPADGAQTRAVVRALSGQSFVLEGPPGTGKSQTITNLLANALVEGRKVLFVAEKEAARDVVKERLQAVGLDPFILDLHDKGSTTDQIKKQLADALDFTPSAPMERWEKVQSAFAVAARALETYRSRLHGPTSAGRSYSSAYDTLLELGPGPQADIGRALAHVPADAVSSTRRLLLDLNDVTTAAQPSRHHPWRFAGVTAIEDVDRPALSSAIERVALSLSAVQAAEGAWGSALAQSGSTDGLRASRAAMLLVDEGRLPTPAQWRAIARQEWMASVTDALDRASAALEAMRSLSPDLPAELLMRDFAPLASAVQAAASSFPLGRKGRVRQALRDLTAYSVFADLPAAVAMVQHLEASALAYRYALATLAAAEGLGVDAGSAVNAQALEAVRARAQHLATVAATVTSDSAGGQALLAALAGVSMPAPTLRAHVDTLVDGIDEVLHLTRAGADDTRAWLSGREIVAAVAASQAAWTASADGDSFVTLRRWADLRTALEPLSEEPFGSFRRQLLNGEISGEDAPEAFDRALMNATLLVVGEDHQFDVFDWMGHDRQISRFIALLEERQRLLETVIPQVLFDSRAFDASASIGVVGQFRQELNAKRRGARSVRDLINRYPDLILQLTPCFLMSPDSVAKFLEAGKVRFDLVVFDEASQIRVADAVGAMGRADSVVIVGDSRQMPPSSGFGLGGPAKGDRVEYEDNSEPVPEDADSILEECVESGLPREMLSWHYRSRDELLIHFSNHHYYDGRLASFPAPVSSRPDCGIDYHLVPGQFDHGSTATNPIEADSIVDEVRRRVHHPHLSQYSMGVVTLNEPQMSLILEKLRALHDPAIIDLLDNEEPDRELFVLNLESVQGRERDVIILGTSFSKRANGDPMPLFFGPLNQARGERRLNVAITRARRQVIVFSSFHPDELLRANAPGLKHLREYLELARSASSDRAGLEASTAPSTLDAHTREVAEALRARGLVVLEGYGLSSFKVDLAVTTPERPDEWLVGVLLDGAQWGRRELALDRDALPVTVLRNLMEWPAIARVWLPAWRADRAEIVSHIHDLATVAASGRPQESHVVDLAEAIQPTDRVVATPPPPEAVASSEFDSILVAPADFAAGVPAGIDPSEAWLARQRRSGTGPRLEYWEYRIDDIYGTPADLDRDNSTVTMLLESLADTEGPVLVASALRKVAKAFGLDRVRETRLETMSRNLPLNRLIRTEFGDFLFPLDTVDGRGDVLPSFDWYRQTTFTQRHVDVIAPHEIANVLVERVTAAHGVSEDELAADVLAFFGYGRRTADTIAYAGRIIRWALARGYLRLDGDIIRPRS